MKRIEDAAERVAGEVKGILSDEKYWPVMHNETLKEASLLYPLSSGKAFRPLLTTLSCECLGGDRKAAVLAGSAIELYHNSTLVHDDIIDNDDTRRNNQTVHAKYSALKNDELPMLTAENKNHYGLTMAILAGDMLQSWTAHLLSVLPSFGVSSDIALKIVSELFYKCSPTILAGETLDVQLPLMNIEDVTLDMINMVMKNKTAELFRFSAFTGGLLAEKGYTENIRYLEEFALSSGMAFQLRDDILGIMGDEKRLGKPVGSDIKEGKRTYILHYAFSKCNDKEKQFLSKNIGKSGITQQEQKQIKDIFVDKGAIDACGKLAKNYLEKAMEALDKLPNSEQKELLQEFNEFIINRTK